MSDWVRPSKDLDLHMHGVTVDDLSDLLDRAAAEVAHVGIRVEWGACKPLWRPDGTAGGEKVRVVAWLGRTRVNFEVDCWVGGERSPGMRVREVASLVPGLPPVRMLAYPLEAMAADKLHAIAQFGSANTRLKDFYDLWHLTRAGLDPMLLSECVAVVFRNNERAVALTPTLLPGFGRSFGVANGDAWAKMLSAAGRADRAPADFVEVVGRVRAFANRAFAPETPAPQPVEADECEPSPAPFAFA
ncbi:nucleotidyl transferase AbiEii/AbiGii toxin family protein [Aurantimonas sp. A2-1-M11]|uniref:nucleotidyl transferase AbiEii/AbiGii toxin family protein n=1 Tax=Aurantimonas sp. A2-1-M11 TaxID=3113712 RepID=UPI002F91C143